MKTIKIATTSFYLRGVEIPAGAPVPAMSDEEAKYLGHAIAEIDPTKAREKLITQIAAAPGAPQPAKSRRIKRKASANGPIA